MKERTRFDALAEEMSDPKPEVTSPPPRWTNEAISPLALERRPPQYLSVRGWAFPVIEMRSYTDLNNVKYGPIVEAGRSETIVKIKVNGVIPRENLMDNVVLVFGSEVHVLSVFRVNVTITNSPIGYTEIEANVIRSEQL